MYNVKQIMDGVFHIGDGRGNFCTLLRGKTAAILYDTMMGLEDLKGLVASLAPFEPTVINSHCHFDHVGGNCQFESVYMGRADFPLLDIGRGHIPILEETLGLSLSHMEKSFEKDRVKEISPGTVIDLGGMTVEVLALPGHTPGCLGLLCREHRLLLAGDAISPQACLFFPESSIDDYARTLESLCDVPFDTFLLSHFDFLFEKSMIEKFAACIDLVGKKRGREYVFPSIPSLRGRLYVLDLMDPKTGELIGIFTKETHRVDIYLADAEALASVEKQCLPLLTESRRRAAESCKEKSARLRGIAAGLLLRHVLGVRSDEELSENEYGKPYLISGKAQFNLSNAGKYSLLAVSDIPIGADIEPIREDFPNDLRRYFLPEELGWLDGEPTAERFYTLWTRLESMLKAQGVGFAKWRQRNDSLLQGLWYMENAVYDGHMLACAAKESIELRLIPVSADELITEGG